MTNQELTKEIIVAAIQNGLIPNLKNTKDTANEVAEFYKIVFEAVSTSRR